MRAVCFLLALSCAGQIVEGPGGGGGGGGGATGTPNYKLTVNTTATSWTITSAQHGFTHSNLLVQCYTAATPAVPLIAVASAPAAGQFSYTVHPSTFAVAITFTAGGNNGGYCAVNGSGAGTAGPPGEVTSAAGTYADGQMVVASGTSGDIIRPYTSADGVLISAGNVISTAGTTGTGAAVFSISPTLTGTPTTTNLTATAGTIDFSGSSFLRIPVFTTGAPTADCDEAAEVGRVRMRSQDPATANGGVRVCLQTATGTYGWQPASWKTGTTLPATCTIGDLFVDTDATPAGRQLYVCSAANTWSLTGDGGGGGVASTTSALRGDGGGNAIAVTGTPTDCVRVDGSSTSCGGGGGGSGGIGFTMTVNTGSDTVTLTATRNVNFQRGREVTTVLSGETFTWDTPTGSGDYIIYYNGGMVLSSLALTGVGSATTSSRPVSSTANATTGLQLPQGGIPLFAGTVTTDNFTTSSVNLWAGDNAPWIIAPGLNVTVTESGDTLTLSFSGVGGVTDAPYLTSTAVSGLSAEVNLGALTSGLMRLDVAGGTATPSTATPGPHYFPGADDVSTFADREEFFRHLTSVPWSTSGTGCTVTMQAGENNHPGIIRLNTTGNTSDRCEYFQSGTPNTIGFLSPVGAGATFTSFASRHIFRTATVANIAIAVGLISVVGGTALPAGMSADVITFKVDSNSTTTCTTGATSVPANRWHFAMRHNNGAWHCIDTALDASTLTVAATTWYEPVIWSTSPGTMNFGVRVAGGALINYGSYSGASLTTNPLKPQAVITTQNAAIKTLDLDFWSAYMTGLAR